MIKVVEFQSYADWVDGLKDRRAVARIESRITRMTLGNFGDAKSVGKGVSELWINYGPGYRVYYTKREDGTLVILLGGGTKKRQSADITKAQALAARLE